MSAWTVDRDGRTLLGYRRTHGDFKLAVLADSCGWWWAVRGAAVIVAEGRVDGPIAGMEAADYALAEVVR